MNEGKILLIDTNKGFLGDEGCSVFGRFFIALIYQAAMSRRPIPENERTPFMLYVDEAYDYFDETIEHMLSQLRKYKVGCIFAHQFLDQLHPESLRKAILTCTSTKMVGGLNHSDRRAFANEMGCAIEALERPQKREKDGVTEFAMHIRNATKEPAIREVLLGEMNQKPTLTDEQYTALIKANRMRVSAASVANSPYPPSGYRPTVAPTGRREEEKPPNQRPLPLSVALRPTARMTLILWCGSHQKSACSAAWYSERNETHGQ